jgi:hypothetical protein
VLSNNSTTIPPIYASLHVTYSQCSKSLVFSLIRADKHKVYKCNKCSLFVRPGAYPPILASCITTCPSFPFSKFHLFLDSNSPHMRVMTAFTCLTWRNAIRHKTLKWRRRPLRVKWAFSLIVLFYRIDPVHDPVLCALA